MSIIEPCKFRENRGHPFPKEEAQALLHETLKEWTLNEMGTKISRTYKFENYSETVAFVNAVAWISLRENHHPDLEVGYNRCIVHYTTHSIKGLSENDFICATKIDALFC